MEIKVVKSDNKSNNKYLHESVVLEYEYEKSDFKDVNHIKYYLTDIEKMTKTEILPNIEKYDIGEVVDISGNNDYLYFFNIFNDELRRGTISIIRYNIKNSVTESIFSYNDNIYEYPKIKKIKVFVINDNSIIIQKELLSTNASKSYAGFFMFELKYVNIKEDKSYDILNENFKKNGISDMIYISDSLCAIKTGFSLLEDNRYNVLEKDEVSLETVGLINTNEMLSDISIDTKKINIQVLDQAYFTNTIHYIKKSGKYLIYSKIDNENKVEEVKFYNIDSGETLSCINKDVIRVSNLANPYVINNEPYVCIKKANEISFLNIITGKITVKFRGDLVINKVLSNSIIMSSTKKKFLSKSYKTCIELYSFPDKNVLFKENAEDIDCIVADNDVIYIVDK